MNAQIAIFVAHNEDYKLNFKKKSLIVIFFQELIYKPQSSSKTHHLLVKNCTLSLIFTVGLTKLLRFNFFDYTVSNKTIHSGILLKIK